MSETPDSTRRQLVLLRHGESVWNQENRFTGWTDVDLSDQGRAEASEAGRLLREGGYRFDVVFTSVLKRAVRTAWLVLDAMDLMWVPLRLDWRLNERHYGALQGMDKAETIAKYGAAQVQAWRRSYDVRPPALLEADARHPGHDVRYAPLGRAQLPATECLQDTVARLMPCWRDSLQPALSGGQSVLIAGHGNSLRALVKQLDGISDAAIADLEIPTGIPLVYELDGDLRPLGHHWLGNAAGPTP